MLRNVTITYNAGRQAGGIRVGNGLTGDLENSVVAENARGNCGGPLTSLGHNAFGSLAGCGAVPQATDTEGTSGGSGVVPLLPGRAGIDAGNPDTCSPLDQLYQRRVGVYDKGAAELQ